MEFQLDPIGLTTIASNGLYIKRMVTGTVSVTPGSVAANGVSSTTTTINGLATGDIIIAAIETPLGGPVRFEAMYPSAANTATISFSNSDFGTARSRGATTIRYLWLDIT